MRLSPSLRLLDYSPSSADTSEDDSEGSDDVVAKLMAVLDPCSVATHTFSLPLPSPHSFFTLPSSPNILLQTGRQVKDGGGMWTKAGRVVHKEERRRDKTTAMARKKRIRKTKTGRESQKRRRVRWRKEMRTAGEDDWKGEGEHQTRKCDGETGRSWMLDQQDASSKHGCEGEKEEE
ncbi:hypothetical protein BLNAU_8426 [Blattamonas nauphoetae]|uniref:Uncharacterized protein n=1 Tax=Blattamonas nauphoetae TaxID=2049346 RepID=A0ABQ9XYR1_9EUKA|nr:hypothetical protein BLNAU_8426 [Blattamonas nauphoetae]